jgi:hypothetical protein
MHKTIKIFEKNKFQEIRIGITEYQGNDLIDIRVWTQGPKTQEKVPTPKGVSLNVRLFPELKEAVTLLEKELRENKLLE